MKGNLLDTNVALLAVRESAALSLVIRNALLQGPNYLSVLSLWEVLLKSMKGKLVAGDPHRWWQDTLFQLAATPLPLRAEHIIALSDLPAIHQDPFDRTLITQATAEGLTLLTTDQQIFRYRSATFSVIL